MKLSKMIVAITLFATMPASAQDVPKDGAAVLERMRAAYDGKWYKTLTFAQKTTTFTRDGTKRITSWKEYLRYTPEKGVELRIDMGEAARGNSVLYTADSSWNFRGGKLAGSSADGNPFIPLIEGVYVQPVAKTLEELKSTKIDMSKVSTGTWNSRPVWIVGASSRSDTTSAQFWVDSEKHVLLRMIMSLGAGDPIDVHLDDYVAAGNAVIATKILMYRGGKPMQFEEYADWKVDVPVSEALFNVKAWILAP